MRNRYGRGLRRLSGVVSLVLLFGVSHAQTVLVDYPFTGDSPAPTDVAIGLSATDFSVSSGSLSYGTAQEATWTGSGVPYVQGNGGWSQDSIEEGKYFSFTLNTDSADDFDLEGISFLYRATGAGPSAMTVTVNGSLVSTIDVVADETLEYNESLNLDGLTSAEVRIIGWHNDSRTTTGGGAFRLDDVRLHGSVNLEEVPVLMVSTGQLTGLSYVENSGPSDPRFFEITGINLDESDVTITAPDNFELSGTEAGTYSGSVTLSSYDGSSETIWVRLESGLNEGIYSGDVVVSGGGASSETVALSGRVVDPFAVPYSNTFRTNEENERAVIQGFLIEDADQETAAGGYLKIFRDGFVQTPAIDFTELDFIEVDFSTATFGAGSSRKLELLISSDGGDNFASLFTAEPASSTYDNNSLVIDLTGVNNVADGLLRFEMTDGTGQIRFRDLAIAEFEPSVVPDPVFSVPAGTYFEDQTVFISNSGDYEATATVYYTTDGSDPDDQDAEYSDATGILLEDGNGAITLKAIAIDGSEESGITSATYTFPLNVADIQALRSQATGSTIYRVDNEATLTAQTSFRNTKFFQDDSGFGIQIDDPGPPTITTEYDPGDNVSSLVGTLGVFEGQLRLTPSLDPGDAVSSGNMVLPVTRTLDELGFDEQARLVLVESVAFEDGDGTATFGGGGFSTSITDPSLAGFDGLFRNVIGESDITGSIIPQDPVNVTGVIQQNSAGMNLAARSLADFDPAEKTVVLTGPEGFRMLASPIATDFSEILSSVWTQGIPNAIDPVSGADPNVWIWDNSSTTNTSGNWEPVPDMENSIVPGTGFLAYIFEDDDGNTENVVGGFPKTLSVRGVENFTGVAPPVNANAAGWSLLGNPFNAPVSFEALERDNLTDVIYVWDEDTGSWKTWSVDAGVGDIAGGIIPAFQGFFVQNTETGNGEVTFHASAKTTGGQFIGKQAQPELVRLELSGQGMSNSAWLTFSENGSMDVLDGDALKLAPLSPNYALLAAMKGDVLLDISILPKPDLDFELPLRVETTIPGTYTLGVTDMSMSNGQELYLVDRVANSSVELSKNMLYEFDLDGAAKLVVADPFDLLSDGTAKVTADSEPRFVITAQQPVSTEIPGDVPKELELTQNYPNPFNPSTIISYSVPEQAHIRLTVYDMLGRQIAVLVDEQQGPGGYDVTWDGTDFSSGMYLYRIEAGNQSKTRRMMLIK